MKITSVRYRKLITGEHYSNRAVEAEATVEEGQDPESVLLELSNWVHGQLGEGGIALDLTALRQERDYLMGQRNQLRASVATAQAEKRKLQDEITSLEITREKAGGAPAIPF